MSYKNIDPKFKKRWLKALRTPPDEGGYVQTDGALYSSHLFVDGVHMREDAFCCLGVACNLLVLKGALTWEDEFLEQAGYKEGKLYHLEEYGVVDPLEKLDNHGMPPQEVLDMIGMSPKAASHVADLNDDGKSFADIADWIEDHL